MPKPYTPNDAWSRRAAAEGFRARSVYKLREIDERFGLLRPSMTVLRRVEEDKRTFWEEPDLASQSAESLHGIFNPAAALFPFTLLIFVCWSLACGNHRLLPAAVLLASFCAQCHLAFVLPGAGLLAVGFAGLALSRTGRGRPRAWPWIAAAAATAAICWTPAIVDQVKHSPGNLHLHL